MIAKIGVVVAATLLCTSAFAETTGEILVGNGDTGRPADWKGMTYPCGDVKAIARSFCTVHTADGDKVSNFKFYPVSNVTGGQCGWTVYKIECL